MPTQPPRWDVSTTINSTVYFHRTDHLPFVDAFWRWEGNVVVCIANINSYAGSIGTTTIQYPNDGNALSYYAWATTQHQRGIIGEPLAYAIVITQTLQRLARSARDNGDFFTVTAWPGLLITPLSKRHDAGGETPPHVVLNRAIHCVTALAAQAYSRPHSTPGRSGPRVNAGWTLFNNDRAAQLEGLSPAQLSVGLECLEYPEGYPRLRQRQQQPPRWGELRRLAMEARKFIKDSINMVSLRVVSARGTAARSLAADSY